MKDKSGEKYGRLTIQSFSHRKGSHYYWNCICECGETKIVDLSVLISGNTRSCGCLKNEIAATHCAKLGNASRQHGMSKTRFFQTWVGMVARTTKPTAINYYRYGGTGITVCDSWLKFENFRDDMLLSFKEHSKIHGEKNTTLDRTNNKKGYSKENCQWATYKEQGRNTKFNRYIEYNGERKCLTDWADAVGINPGSLSKRLDTFNWSIEKALTTPKTR